MAKLTEVISKLEELYAQYGDLPVYTLNETELDIDDIEWRRSMYYCGEYWEPERIAIA